MIQIPFLFLYAYYDYLYYLMANPSGLHTLVPVNELDIDCSNIAKLEDLESVYSAFLDA